MNYHILVQLLTLSCSGNEEKLLALLTPLNVNCHASDGRKSTPLHLAAGYNRTRIVQLLLTHGADVHAKDKVGLDFFFPMWMRQTSFILFPVGKVVG